MIPSYRRPTELLRCLAACAAQSRRADDVIVVARGGDDATRAAALGCASASFPVRVVRVDQPGTVAARNAGVAACCTDVLAMADDDTVPRPDWLARILAHFHDDPRLGGLGGRDRCHDGTGFVDRQAATVGRLQWFGRVIGNHHLGFGNAREVDLLKGANMSYRADVFRTISFDTRLRGSGAQANEDVAFSLLVRHAGWRLLYDPQVLVDHYERPRDEPRYYGGVISLSDVQGFREFGYNEVVAIWDLLPAERRLAFAAWSLLVGTKVAPGFVQAVRFTPRLRYQSWRRFAIMQQSKWQAMQELGWRRVGRSSPGRGSDEAV